ncbi:WRKY Transcription Factor [Ancistrocladus abbreviatus]
MLSQAAGLVENQGMSSEMGFYSNPTNLNFLPPLFFPQASLKPFIMPSSLTTDAATSNLNQTLLLSTNTTTTATPKPRQDMGVTQLLPLQRSTPNLWAWHEGKGCMGGKKSTSTGDENEYHLGVSTMKMKKIKARRKVREPRFCFKTLSDVDVLDDGYKWRKYGQKVVKNTQHPRSYYRCTQDNCRVKKRVERLAEDPRMVITTYEGRHVHSP